ncbi:ABC transporter ATP-binding protein [Floccifex sp.]|uniref:ABC transporter ATP-binding protein n=1 Tax=Floccifex sp. TaxID=2815810 RepID=UPI002A75CDF7|nr:ABC transporter ATP-binding protein [Floccifex sp.]MDD7281614.1 ABC transporter ATP-binding protein [Erysipelotrichaceae bacterium]MDY2958479.1 ABC transporter ATP-binding protein [Floccifex sp.]
MTTLKKFINYYKPYKTIFILDLICACLISIIDLLFPLILNYCTNTLFIDKQNILSILPYLALFLLILYTIRALSKYFVSSQGHIMGAKMERDMRNDLFDQYQKLSFRYYDENNTGVMMSRITTDLFDISEFAHHGPENLFISFLKISGSFIILMSIYWPLALILLVITIAMGIFSYFNNKKMRATFDDNRRKIGEVNASVQDSLSGIRVVQSFTNEQVEKEKFDYSNNLFLESKKNNYRAMGIFQSGNNFFQGLLYASVLIFGGYFVALGNLEVIDLATFALYIGIFISPIEVLVELTEMFQKGISGFRRFEEVVSLTPEIKDEKDAKELKDVKGNIDFNHVYFQYNQDETLLQDVSLSIKAGTKVALVGPSGSGKTTICSLIPRFYDVDQGEILIDGQNIRSLQLKSLRQNIGIVQQDVYLFSGTIAQNISYGKENASFEEIVEASKKANIHDFIQSLPDGYDTFVGQRGARLSGGQKQRIAIARVFLKNPKILILDEATSALDNESEQVIQNSLDELAKNRTCITIAHRLSTIKNADEILVVDSQGIKEKGTHEELMKINGLYAKYYQLQFEKRS